MARKSRPTFPMAPASDAEEAAPKPVRRSPMFAKGAASLETALKSAAAEERMFRNLPIAQIDPSPIRDRIDIAEGLEVLKRSLAEDGQQIPILVRPLPGDRYEIVTGRRRLRALTELGQDTIQAFVRRMSDEEAFVAQGIENNARLETSFIERARTILSALEAGFTQVQVEKFLGVDQTMISRMKSIYTAVGEDLVVRIGPARGVGRRKWDRLAKLLREGDAALVRSDLPDSTERFDALLEQLEAREATPPAPQAEPRTPKPAQEAPVVTTRRGTQLTVKLREDIPDDFLDYLAKEIPALLEAYKARG
ncbi:plasmid partitioning protein RepB [Salipiger sp. 1_MG-2023]|uniref:plasmid partitioning protein RepB n=1 Tax=Salipiger sp. 1_MG-2023 TaxID=3062665 RepID=UPI0026E20512|nr:plasmid partitioning protein RepB [Salipiger sp. 1_MG-2023]MDO6588453.1 plasmid partitioning protein RepB [Salipiger sp. 1_MG-2023]